MFGIRGNGGATGAEENNVEQVTQPTQAELDTTKQYLTKRQSKSSASLASSRINRRV